MLIACKCLNVSLIAAYLPIDTESLKSAEINFDDLQQQSKINEDHLHFFKKAIGPLSQIIVNYQQVDLVKVIPVEQWSLHFCINCETITHAVKINKDIYLINSSLLTNEEDVNILKSSDNFSKTFGIIINQPSRKLDGTDCNRNGDTDSKTKNLTQHYRNIILKKIETTDEKIRQFSEQQFTLLNTFREKAEQDYSILVRMIRNVPELTTNAANTVYFVNPKLPTLDTPPVTPDSTPMSIGNSPSFKSHSGSGTAKPSTPIKSKNSPIQYSTLQQYGRDLEASTDVDFFLEMDEITSERYLAANIMSDVEESDTDESTGDAEGIAIPRQVNRPKSLNIAQSLPVTVPTLNGRTSVHDDDYDEYANADDIAASIKALAKSVHGDAVFGELPRPRFSTQI